MYRSLFALMLISSALVATGCGTSAELVQQREIIGRQIHQIDSLRIMQRQLLEQVSVLSDSLQFIDDIRSGQYYRDMRSLRDEITRLEYELKIGRDGITVATLLADDLFSAASADLTPAGRRMIDQLAGEISARFEDHMIYVEGHADTLALGPTLEERYGSNWGLSAMRAASVVDYLVEEHEMDSERVAVVGYSDTRPVASNADAVGRRANRRIRVSAHPIRTP